MENRRGRHGFAQRDNNDNEKSTTSSDCDNSPKNFLPFESGFSCCVSPSSKVVPFSQLQVLPFEKRYNFKKMIGQGGQAKVHKAYDIKCKQHVAIKTYDKRNMSTFQLELIANETIILQNLNHPCICQAKDYHEDDDRVYFVMDLMVGDIRDLLRQEREPLFERDAKCLFSHMLSAVCYLHQKNIIHRDVKLENFLVDLNKKDKYRISVKMIDFGLAVFYNERRKPSQKCGTMYTMAPEIFMQDVYDHKVDCWALGVVLFQLLTNQRPFFAFQKSDLKSQILTKELKFEDYPSLAKASPECLDLLSKLLTRDPRNRISSADAMKHEWITKKQHQ